MESADIKPVLTVALMAAFADGNTDEREREAIKRVSESLRNDVNVDLAAMYREVLLNKPDLTSVTASIKSAEARRVAYEMAVAISDADGRRNDSESQFLSRLAAALQLPAATIASLDQRAAEMAAAAESASPQSGLPPGGAVLGRANLSQGAVDAMIRKAAVTNAALELLPDTLGSMAIIPLQMRLVYRIGKAYGYAMDRSHARDFIATLGVGLGGQYIEQFGRKLLGGLLGTLAGGVGGALGRQAASSGLAFATTYAIGRVAERYYAGGRTLDATALKQAFNALLAEARQLAPSFRQEIEQTASTLDTRNLSALMKQD